MRTFTPAQHVLLKGVASVSSAFMHRWNTTNVRGTEVSHRLASSSLHGRQTSLRGQHPIPLECTHQQRGRPCALSLPLPRALKQPCARLRLHTLKRPQVMEALSLPLPRALKQPCARLRLHTLKRLQVMEAALQRPTGQGLITVCNHVAAMDDPLVMASLVPPQYFDQPASLRCAEGEDRRRRAG